MSPDGGTRTWTVTSQYLAGPTEIEAILPRRLQPGRRYPVLYILPVNPGAQGPWGSGLEEARNQDVANRHSLVCVAPTFDSLPWYADHPTDPAIRQESHFLNIVLPSVESRLPVLREACGRLLVGFSKSGWGAFSLLLRRPDLFGSAASWDAPLMKQAPDAFGMEQVFATPENFEAYKITALVERRANLLRPQPPRLVLMGYGNFREDTVQMHDRLAALGVTHLYDNQTERRHDWHSGWLAEAVKYLMAPA